MIDPEPILINVGDVGDVGAVGATDFAKIPRVDH